MKVGQQWELFYHEENTRNRYRHAGLIQSKLPRKWRPTKVIKGSQRTLQAILPERESSLPIVQPSVGIFSNERIKTILGVYTIDHDEWSLLQGLWHTQKITLLCGSDGGLKEAIGTSGILKCQLKFI